MRLYAIETGNFKLDGGAMFGVVPKALWQKTNPADSSESNRYGCSLSLIENEGRLILIDTGLGNKQSENFSAGTVFGDPLFRNFASSQWFFKRRYHRRSFYSFAL